MTHYVLFRFKDPQQKPIIYEKAKTAFSKLRQGVSCILDAHVFLNCVERNSNADLLIKLELDSPEALEIYLRHPLHRKFVLETDDLVEQRITFDNM